MPNPNPFRIPTFTDLPQCSFSTHSSLYATVASSSSSLQDNITTAFSFFCGFFNQLPHYLCISSNHVDPSYTTLFHYSLFSFHSFHFNFVFLCFFFFLIDESNYNFNHILNFIYVTTIIRNVFCSIIFFYYYY